MVFRTQIIFCRGLIIHLFHTLLHIVCFRSFRHPGCGRQTIGVVRWTLVREVGQGEVCVAATVSYDRLVITGGVEGLITGRGWGGVVFVLWAELWTLVTVRAAYQSCEIVCIKLCVLWMWENSAYCHWISSHSPKDHQTVWVKLHFDS